MTRASKKPDARVPLTGLFGVALEAMLEDFQQLLKETEFNDIRPTHGCVFRFVKGDGMRLTEIAELAGMTKQSVGEVVDDLVVRGYVQRIPDPGDKRAKLICLTERGEQAQATGFGLFAEVEKEWIKRYGAERVTQMRALLEEIAANEAPEAVPELARPELAHV
ncbi:MAG TPA: MarR family winged helix-turn-helix transcriptional regulator [Solirubrobacterales bacterium]|nr:MarR family winged helix-turn-helix transcriptional regulator [Solirubrobacterales bacterium]